MTYEIIIYEQAQMDLAALAKSEPKAFAKAQRFIEELKVQDNSLFLPTKFF